MEIDDIRGASFPAIDVFAASIGALREHMMGHVERQGLNLQPDEIKWVLTVPAMWTDKAKEFMRESAEKVALYTNVWFKCVKVVLLILMSSCLFLYFIL